MRSRWPILAIHCLLVSRVVPGILSASLASCAETGVGAFDLAEQVRVGVERSLTLELRPGCAPTYDDLASDSLLAARGAANARRTFVAADGTKITGFNHHGINRAIGDGGKRAGVRPEALLDAIRNPRGITPGVDALGRPFKISEGTHARVLVNPETG